MSALLFDLLLGLALLWLAVRSLWGRTRFDEVMAFIGLGVLMALAWVRLGALDVALAEAVLGGGVTGALLLGALRRLRKASGEMEMTADRPVMIVWLLALVLVGGLVILVAWVLEALPAQAPGLGGQVRERLVESGVSAEVTAVLLNFRGYDTLLEVAVLLAALLGTWHLGELRLPGRDLAPSPVLEGLVRLLVPLTVLIAGYLLWLGGHAAGGAFQAGALLAGAGVLLLVSRSKKLALRDNPLQRLLVVAGSMVFTLVAAVLMLAGGMPLEYPKPLAGQLILLIEGVSALSIGITLSLLFAGGRPRSGGHG